ncbi:elongation factor 1-delta isoform X4 [Macrosteles quadrilineatus]|nr:elongation factor 1-delta isoform X4 [Macrosteles quadrilineatus]
MEVAFLAQEKVWFDKYKYEDAEKVYFENLSKMDGIAKLSTDNMAAEITNRLKSLELENSHLKKDIVKLTELVKQLNDRVFAVEKSATGKSGGSAPVKAPAPAKAPANDDDDDGVDLFASESEDEDEEAKKIKEQRLAEYAARKSKKPVLIAKSNIILDVKPWDDETDMKKMEEEVRKITMDGLIWGASKLVPLAYGIQKLQISCVVEDDKVSVDDLQEQIEAIEDYVQSIDIAAFNKV